MDEIVILQTSKSTYDKLLKCYLSSEANRIKAAKNTRIRRNQSPDVDETIRPLDIKLLHSNTYLPLLQQEIEKQQQILQNLIYQQQIFYQQMAQQNQKVTQQASFPNINNSMAIGSRYQNMEVFQQQAITN